ncbi:SU10 major capsid protein [Viridibacillus arvi]|uniref:SU10 major capsid protein n=1 Tax=Viridibacillus arvi TaxID=263475 RepID=UPI003D27A712
MFTSQNFTANEKISLSKEIAEIGKQATPFTSLLMSKGNVEKALSTIYNWREKTLDNTEDISAVEGSETTVFQKSVRKEYHNVLEIFKKAVSISGTAGAMENGQFTQEVADRLLELKIALEKKLINGIKDDGSTSGKRAMSGLIEFSDVTNAVTGKIATTVDLTKQAARKLWDQDIAEGNLYVLIGADAKEQVDEFYKGSYSYQHVTTNFGIVADSVNTNYGTLNYVLSKHIPADKIVVFNDSYVDLVTLRDAHFEALAKTGDNEKGQVVGEYSLKVGSPKGISVITITK